MDKPPFSQELEGGYERYKRSVHIPTALMLPYVSGRLSAPQAAMVSQHIAECTDCQELENCARAFLTEKPITDEGDSAIVNQMAERAALGVQNQIRGARHDLPLSLKYEGDVMSAVFWVVLESNHKFSFGPLPGSGKYVLCVAEQSFPFELTEADLNPFALEIPVARGGRRPKNAARGKVTAQHTFSQGRVRLKVLMRGDQGASLEIEIAD
jgi:hypothetical protein